MLEQWAPLLSLFLEGRGEVRASMGLGTSHPPGKNSPHLPSLTFFANQTPLA